MVSTKGGGEGRCVLDIKLGYERIWKNRGEEGKEEKKGRREEEKKRRREEDREHMYTDGDTDGDPCKDGATRTETA